MAQQVQNTNKKCKKQQISQKPKPETMKNVLVTPYRRSWPIIPMHQQQEFNDLFYSNLSLLVPQKQPKIAWSMLKDVPRENRKDIRQRYRQPIVIDLNIRKSLIFGVNECTKALEKRQLVAVLISLDCNPEMMVNHVVRIAERQKIAVLVIRSLKSTLKDVIGFPCVCLGFRNYDKLNEKLKETVEFIYNIKNMKIDVNRNVLNENVDGKELIERKNNSNTIHKLSAHVLSSCTPENVNFQLKSVEISNNTDADLSKIQHSDTISISRGLSIDSPKNPITALFDNTTISKKPPVNTVQAPKEITISKRQLCENPRDFINLSANIVGIDAGPYLYRTCLSKRTFVPPKFDKTTVIVKVLKRPDDFIAFSGHFEAYIPSKIKRMKGKNRKN